MNFEKVALKVEFQRSLGRTVGRKSLSAWMIAYTCYLLIILRLILTSFVCKDLFRIPRNKHTPSRLY